MKFSVLLSILRLLDDDVIFLATRPCITGGIISVNTYVSDNTCSKNEDGSRNGIREAVLVPRGCDFPRARFCGSVRTRRSNACVHRPYGSDGIASRANLVRLWLAEFDVFFLYSISSLICFYLRNNHMEIIGRIR